MAVSRTTKKGTGTVAWTVSAAAVLFLVGTERSGGVVVVRGAFVSPPSFATRRAFSDRTISGSSSSSASNVNVNVDAPSFEDPSPDDPTAFVVGILGDLHIDPRDTTDIEVGRSHWLRAFETPKSIHPESVALISLGDLGESKNCDHNPLNPFELYAGTTLCHETASEYLRSFDVPYEVVGGNHDLEGIDEFKTDSDNLNVFLRCHGKETPQFCRTIAEKTLLVGLGSTIFREAKYTSHEVVIDDDQIRWFEDLLRNKKAEDGWKIFVFTHAPPNGSGLRVLQENHVINGCCWLNHSSETNCRKFIELVRENRSIKAWFSGHFHLGQDYQDSVTFPTIDPSEGPYPNRGSCVFAQTSVMRSGSSRDGRRQSRLLRGNKNGFEICTVDHNKDGSIRLDATITYRDDSHEVGVYAHDDEAYNHDEYFKVYTPQENDDGYFCAEDDEICMISDECAVSEDTVCWWRLSCGRVLGMLNGMLLEYDSSTLAPLGLVVSADELVGKKIAVIDSGTEECVIDFDDMGMEGADCADGQSEYDSVREQAVIMYDEITNDVTVIQPNEDGSYWRKIVRNKIARMKERRREKAAIEFAQDILAVKEEEIAKEKVKSTWGPYTSTSGVAKTTVVPGVYQR